MDHLLFSIRMTFHCLGVESVVIPSPTERHLGWSSVSATMNEVTEDIHVQVLCKK